MTIYPDQLLPLLDRHLNEEELRTLCFQLGEEYDNLGGRGKAANARELIALMQRQRRLEQLVAALRKIRPQVAWPDPPPPTNDAVTHALQAQAQSLFKQAKRLLAPHVRLPTQRDALFSEAFYPAHEWVLDQIDFADSAAVFLPRCWRTLLEIGPDGSLHVLLLRQLKSLVGEQQQQKIDELAIAWQVFCAAHQVRSAPKLAAQPVAQPIADAADRPTLFISYADRDAALARRLATELAAYGHVCRLQRPAHKGSGDWLAATAAALGNAYAVLLLVGAQTPTDRWQRIEYLGAADRQKLIIPIRLGDDAALPPHVAETPLALPLDTPDDVQLDALLARLPAPPAPARRTWAGAAETLQPRLAELAYMDRLKLAELQHVAQYTRLSGEAELRRDAGGRIRLNPVVARTEFIHAPWREEREAPLERFPFDDAVDQLQAIGRAVLLGDPGAGKTTTFYRLAADLIAAALQDKSAPVPLMVRLGLWTAAEEPFPAFLRRSVGELGPYLDGLLAGGRAALLLDGINEIPANQQAAKYRQVRDYLRRQDHVMAWVSCREQDYPPERELGLDRVTVAPLDAVRVREFIGNYLDPLPDFGPQASADLFWQLAGEEARETYARFEKAMAEKLPDAGERFATFWLDDRLPDGVAWGWLEGSNRYWEKWLKQRAHPASLLLLATNPYMLFMLLDVYQAYRRLPANRGQLFDQFVETLLVREDLLARDADTKAIISLPAGEALLAALTELAFALQTQRTGKDGDEAAQTALPLAEVGGYLTGAQQHQAVSANLLTIGDDERFAHQLLQEYFAARAMRERIFGGGQDVQRSGAEAQRLKAAEIWPPQRWWRPTNWEEATILLAGLYSDDCTPVLDWVADAQPELAARCIVESGAHTPEATKLRLRDRWLPRLTDLRRDPDARARAAVGRALGRVTLADGTPLDNRPGVGIVVQNGVKVPDIAWGKKVPTGMHPYQDSKIEINQPYRLSRYPITYTQFQCFVEAEDFDDERWWVGMPAEEEAYGTRYRLREVSEQAFPFGNHPRERVSWYQAVAFCRWLSDKLGETIELPHEYEWEVAARYPDGRFYPWGDDFDAAKVNTREGDNVGQTTAVGIYPHGRQPELNLDDISGNVWEWCRNKYENPDDDRVDGSGARRALRGGSWYGSQDHARAASRYGDPPADRGHDSGFRVVVRRPPSHRAPDL